MAKIFIVANSSKHSGKTTTSLNLALCFATLTQRTLLISLEEQSWLDALFGLQNTGSVKANTFLTYMKGQKLDYTLFEDFDKVIVDCPVHLNASVFKAFKNLAKLIVPVESEYYGLNNIPNVIREVDNSGMELAGFLPVMSRPNSAASSAVIEQLKSYFGDLVFHPSIQRNYYLGRQKDFRKFSLSELSEKAAVTYLALANTLL
ncbi:ParA family protein [Marinilongibacter aquaticus]|uniref:ParA family protein n=1 Tax=Marinilongibacter aquaticus TaxID=2975157 RepID=UPI0021BD8924|nr:ParA family protein [Marinilongibacter aquaticus]UBM59334.1 ParA family protein [Marinilongibacter aquaticus]